MEKNAVAGTHKSELRDLSVATLFQYDLNAAFDPSRVGLALTTQIGRIGGTGRIQSWCIGTHECI